MARLVYLMEHPSRGRMNVPQEKLQEYLDAGFVEVSRQELPDAAPKAAPKAEPKPKPQPAPKAAPAPAKKASKAKPKK